MVISTASTNTGRVWGRARGVTSYALFPMLGAVTPLLALPAISDQFGASGWAAIAVGQSVGAAASVAVELGWGLTGPQAAAASDRREAARLLTSSIRSRLAVAVGVVPLTVVVVLLLQPAYLLAASLSAAAMTLSGLTANWYFVGLGRPSRIFWSDALPRLASVLMGVLAISALEAPLAVFAVCLVVGYLSSPVIALLLERPRLVDFINAEPVSIVLRRQRVALAGRGLSAIYIGLPVALVQAWTPRAVPAFAAAERLIRMGLLVLQSVPNALQRAVGIASGNSLALSAVARRVLLVQACVGALAGAFCVLALPAAVDLLFSGEVAVTRTAAALAGCIVLLTSLSRGTGLVLVARRQVPWITASAGIAAVTAVCLLAALPRTYGAAGGLAALVFAECAALSVQAGALLRKRPVSACAPDRSA